MSRDVAELLRLAARRPHSGGQLLLLDRLLKRLPLTTLHDPRRLVRSSEVRGAFGSKTRTKAAFPRQSAKPTPPTQFPR